MNANLSALQERFEANPSDAVAFEALEEAHFVGGQWSALVGLYEQRLLAPELDRERRPGPRARLILRLAQVLEERCLRVDEAIARYQQALELDGSLRPALTQLRRLQARREAWDEVLRLAEREAALPLRPAERAALHTEVGDLHLRRRRDPAAAQAEYRHALAAEGGHAPALLGLAEVQRALGDPAAARLALEKAADQLRGAERAAVLVRLGALLRDELGEPERSTEVYRRALTDDPRNAEALRVVGEHYATTAQWPLFDEIQERRFQLAEDLVTRLSVAHDAGRAHLEEMRDPHGARDWFQRARSLFPDDPVVHLYLADVERLSGNQKALADHLKRAAELADDATPVDVLQESAQLERARGDEDLAIEQLRRALERRPEDEAIFDELAGLLRRSDRDEELVELIEGWLARTPDGSPLATSLWCRLGAVHEERTGDATAARQAYERAAAVAPARPDVLDALERLCRKGDDVGALRGHLERALEATGPQAPEAATLHVRLGEVWIDLEDIDRARACFEAGLALDGSDARARQGLERIALATGDDATLLEAFEREAEVTTDRGRLAFLVTELARIHEAAERPERALAWVKRLLAATPEDRGVIEHCARLQQALRLDAELAGTLEGLDLLLHGDERARNRRRLGSLYAQLGDGERSLASYRMALDTSPDDVDAVRAVVELLEPTDRHAELADARRHLAMLVTGEERTACLYGLGRALADQLDDLEGAAAAYEAALTEGGAPRDTEPRLLEVLERLGRSEELCVRLEQQRARLDPLDPQAFELDVRRAEILLERLDRPHDAIELFDAAREANPESERARAGLERALRRVDDGQRLVALLSETARRESDDERRASLELERAALLEERLEQLPEARTVLEELADGASGLAGEAERRLRLMLERAGDWRAVAARIERRLGSGDARSDAARHRELAALYRDRLASREEAARHFEEAGRLEAERPEVWQSLVALYDDGSRDADVVRCLEAELALGPEPARAVALHARAAQLSQVSLDDAERAEHHYRSVLELDPMAAEAVEFLATRFEAQGRSGELAALLEARLARAAGEAPETETSLRLRLAALQAGALGDEEAAIATLAPAAQRDDAVAVVAEPLADLLQRRGRLEELVALARRAAERAELPVEAGGWYLRIGDSLRGASRDAEAADAYREALARRPDDRAVEAALRDVYRRLGEARPLAHLLEAELARVGGEAELPLRRELAALLEGPLDQPAEALVHLRRVLEIAPRDAETLDRAIALAERTGAHAECAELLERAARRARNASQRAHCLARRGRVLGEHLGRPDDAVACFETALTLVPGHEESRAGLRATLQARGDWAGVLDCLERDLAGLPVERTESRAALIEEAVRVAEAHLGPEATLPWLERLRALWPDDASLLGRIAEVHRATGRHDALLRTLDDQLALEPPREQAVALEVERARILEEAFEAPARAAAALERARRRNPDAPEILVALDALYGSMGRHRERLSVLEARIARAPASQRLDLHRAAALLYAAGGDHRASAKHVWSALAAAPTAGGQRVELLRALGEQLDHLGRPDLWARAAEAELAALDSEAPVFAERRRVLLEQLADAHETDGRLDAALRHRRALVDARPEGEIGARAEERLLALLRRTHDAVELERRLTARLTRDAGDADAADAWLELALLRIERLHRPGAAALAFRQVLARRPDDLAAWRGLREASERVGAWADLADALDREIALLGDAPARERAALYRRLGRVSWRELDATPRASQAFAAALEADPGDLEALRSLQQLFENMEDWRGAADLYESEVSVLGESDPGRRQEAWLRAAGIARDRLDDAERALRGYERAAAVAPLDDGQLLAWAELYHATGRGERFAEVFAQWLEATLEASAADHLRLARALEEQDRLDEACTRAERAAEVEPGNPGVWDALAELRQRRGQPSAAAEALDRAAALHGGAEAARRHLHAAELVLESDPTAATRRLERAVAADASLARAHAHLAVARARTGQLAEAERAAERALDMSGSQALEPKLRLEAALAGARAARAQEHLEAATRMLDTALEIAPRHPDALSSQARVQLALGEAAAARATLERFLALQPGDEDRAAHLVLLAEAEEGLGGAEAALTHYREAVERAPDLEDAQAGLTRALVATGHSEEAIAALERWAALAAEPRDRGARLLQAAELELGRDGLARAEALLREALAADPGMGTGWRLACELLASQGRSAELVELAGEALAQDLDAADRARVELLRARALEQRGDAREAARSFARAAEGDPRCAEAALSAARLLRGLGAWREAAEILEAFVERAPADAGGLVAPALHQLGRLRAGPLEDVDGAVAVYRRALDADPELVEAREALADLLVHRPDAWDEATRRHRELLRDHPVRLASLRALLRIARGRGNDLSATTGLALLRALGVATPDERIEAPSRPPVPLARRPRLAPEAWDAVRRMAQEGAAEIGDALGVGAPGSGPPDPGDALARFRQHATVAEGRLAAPSLVPLPAAEVGEVLHLAAQLAHETGEAQGDGNLVNALSGSLNRRVRKRMRRALGEVTPADVAAIDFEAWRAALRALAAATVVDAGESELRTAFLAWLDRDGAASGLPPESDLRDAVAASPEALALLQLVLAAWAETT